MFFIGGCFWFSSRTNNAGFKVFSILVLFSLARVSLTSTFALVLGGVIWGVMAPICLGPAHGVRGVEVLVCISCDVYIVLDGLGRSGKPSHPPVVFCLCWRNGSSPFRLCLPAAPPPFFLHRGFFGSQTPCASPSSTHPSFRGAWPFRGIRGGPALALLRSPLPPSAVFRWEKLEEAPREPRLLRDRAIQLLPPSWR